MRRKMLANPKRGNENPPKTEFFKSVGIVNSQIRQARAPQPATEKCNVNVFLPEKIIGIGHFDAISLFSSSPKLPAAQMDTK